MSLRRLLPYAMIVVLFAGIYRLTMVIPASWFDSEAFSAYRQRIQLQGEILLFLLPVSLSAVNMLEILTTTRHSFPVRLLKSILAVVLTYLFMAGIWHLSSRPYADLFGPHRVSFHFTLAMAVMLTIFLVICLEILQRSLFYFIKKTVIVRYIPRWLRMDNTTT